MIIVNALAMDTGGRSNRVKRAERTSVECTIRRSLSKVLAPS
jgi:hypothetical protein